MRLIAIAMAFSSTMPEAPGATIEFEADLQVPAIVTRGRPRDDRDFVVKL